MIWLLAVGLLSVLAQVVVLRELAAAFYGVELIYLVALATWLLSTGAGAVAARHGVPRPRRLALVFGALAVLLPLDVVLVRGIRWLFGSVPGAYLPFHQQIAGVALSVLPVGLLLGVLFQWAAVLATRRGHSLARAYAAESAGALLGGLAATALFHLGVSNWLLAIGSGAIAFVAPLASASGAARRQVVWLGAAALAVVGVAWPGVTTLDAAMTAWTHPDLLATRDTPYSRVTVTGRAGQVAVFSNDNLVFDTESSSAEAFAALAALQTPAPRHALVLGGTLQGVAGELAAHVRGTVESVELDRDGFEMVRQYLPAEFVQADRVRVLFDDPRRFLRMRDRAEDGGPSGQPSAPFDLIVIATPEPTSGETNRFYTREFFELCREALAPGGVVALRLPAAENFWTPSLTERTASVYRALATVFRHVVVVPGQTLYMFASTAPLPDDPAVLASRLGAGHGRARLVTPQWLAYLYTNDRRGDVTRMLRTADVPANTDARPVCYQYATVVWLSKFYPDLARRLASGPGAAARPWWLWPAAGSLVVALLLTTRRRPNVRLAAAVAIAGVVGMMIETVLILHFQIAHGVVFQDIGLLLSSFMAGLAAGSACIDVLTTRRGAQAAGRLWGLVILGSLAVVSLAVWSAVGLTQALGLAGVGFLLGCTGAAVGATFGYATLRWEGDRSKGLPVLYAGDLLGGCVGTLAATLVLVPQAGLDLTALAAAVLAAAALALV